MKKSLNIFLLLSFAVTIMEPITGMYIHKLAAAVFFALLLVHIVVCRKKSDFKRWLLSAAVLVSFVSGCVGMIWDRLPAVLDIHRAVSIAVVFFSAIHIFIFHKGISGKNAVK